MGSLSIWHWAIILVILVVLFGGKGKVSDLMGDVAKGIKSFKKGLSDDPVDAKSLEAQVEAPVTKTNDKVKS